MNRLTYQTETAGTGTYYNLSLDGTPLRCYEEGDPWYKRVSQILKQERLQETRKWASLGLAIILLRGYDN